MERPSGVPNYPNNPPGRKGGYLGKRCMILWLRAGGSDGLPVYGTEAQGYLPELRGYPLTPRGAISTASLALAH